MKIYILIVLIVSILVSGILILYSNKNQEIISNKYITDKKENRSFTSYTNQEYTNDSISFDFTGFNGKWSFLELESNKEKLITIEDKSSKYEGEFYIVVLDANYNYITMKEVKEAKDIEFITLDEGKFLIRIVGKEASGHCELRIISKDKINAYFKEFWK